MRVFRIILLALGAIALVLAAVWRPVFTPGAIAPEPRRLLRSAPPQGSLDQWPRPPARAPGAPGVPYTDAVTLSETCWKTALAGGYVGGADAQDGPVASHGRA